VPLNMNDFDIILGMGWLSVRHAKMDCYINIVTLEVTNGDRVKLKVNGSLYLTV
jgi:hypothetical protein